jgi:hypothetical protein
MSTQLSTKVTAKLSTQLNNYSAQFGAHLDAPLGALFGARFSQYTCIHIYIHRKLQLIHNSSTTVVSVQVWIVQGVGVGSPVRILLVC